MSWPARQGGYTSNICALVRVGGVIVVSRDSRLRPLDAPLLVRCGYQLRNGLSRRGRRQRAQRRRSLSGAREGVTVLPCPYWLLCRRRRRVTGWQSRETERAERGGFSDTKVSPFCTASSRYGSTSAQSQVSQCLLRRKVSSKHLVTMRILLAAVVAATGGTDAFTSWSRYPRHRRTACFESTVTDDANPNTSLIETTLAEMESDAEFQQLTEKIARIGVDGMTKEERTQRRRALDELGVPNFMTFVTEHDDEIGDESTASPIRNKQLFRSDPNILQLNIG